MDVQSPNPPGKVLVSVLSATWGEGFGGGGRVGFRKAYSSRQPTAPLSECVCSPWIPFPATRISHGHCKSFGALVFRQAKSQGEGVGTDRNPPAVYPALSPHRLGLQPNRQAGVFTVRDEPGPPPTLLVPVFVRCLDPRSRRHVRPRTVSRVSCVPLYSLHSYERKEHDTA